MERASNGRFWGSHSLKTPRELNATKETLQKYSDGVIFQNSFRSWAGAKAAEQEQQKKIVAGANEQERLDARKLNNKAVFIR